jgi:division/cell wall cluster transcriptional repressor MraZ
MEGAGGHGTEGGATATVSTRANVFGHDALAGTYRTRLEANGRLVLPSALRAPFTSAGTGHLLPRRAEAIWLLTPQGFEVMVDELVASQSDGMLATETRTLFFKAAPKVSVDKQSRLVIPPEQREALGLRGEADVVLAGAVERVEIWPADRWRDQEAPKLADLDLLLDGHRGLPTGTA